ncbi:MAG: hypothetical protein IPF68_15905 [Bacteroidales bacterium]|nr:hypothetical protein [Bacteroidales bacterium]
MVCSIPGHSGQPSIYEDAPLLHGYVGIHPVPETGCMPALRVCLIPISRISGWLKH